jgi:hypothetical protein
MAKAKAKARIDSNGPVVVQTTGIITLERLVDATILVPIKGLTPLIPHRWSEKAKGMMPGHPDGDALKKKKGIRKPQEEAEGCLYRLPDGRLGVPATAFKAAMISACRFYDKPSMTEAKLLFYVHGEGPEQLVEVQGNLQLREDTPRNSNGSADLRYRYMITEWSTTLKISFPPSSISEGAVISIIDAAGRCGVCDWRPSAPKSFTGTFGTWRVDA